MSGTPYFPFYPADYLGDTGHLTTEQHGAYLLLLMTAWGRGGRLPNDSKKLARIARVSPRRWHMIGPDVLEFFVEDGDEIVSERLEREHKKAVSKSAKRSASGKRGGLAKSRKSNEPALAIAKQMPCHLPEPEPDKEAKASTPKGRKRHVYSDDFEAFWKAYPDTSNNSKPKASDEWERLDPDDQAAAMRSLPVYRAYLAKPDSPKGVKHVERYLRDRRFETLQPAEAVAISVEPVDLPDTPEGRFLAKARELGVSEIRLRSWLGKFALERIAGATVCIPVGRENEFVDVFGETLKAMKCVFCTESNAAKRRAA